MVRGFFRLLVGVLLPCAMWANPSGAAVVKGKAKLSKHSSKGLHITADDHTIINWEDFSIEAGEYTQFFQPGKHSAVLNRVVGKDMSRILGKLQANGKVYLVNPQGVVIGKDAVIKAGSFLASTLDVSDADFLNQDQLHFQGKSKSGIQNEGTIQAESGDVILIGYTIENRGTVEAPEGTVAIGAGLNVLVKPKDTQKLFIQPELSEKAELGIDNQGAISALETELKADGNLYSKAVRHSGSIDATKTTVRNGRVLLVADKGTTEVSGAIRVPEGEVQVLSENVAVKADALIDVSADNGAGKIFVGGGFQGKQPELICSQETLIEQGATLLADAKLNGNGGQIITWSDGATRFEGQISAQGGSESGDGGFVEVSGKNYLGFNGQVSTLAKEGKTGTLLLDPSDLNIYSFPVDVNITTTPGPPTTSFVPTADSTLSQLYFANLVNGFLPSNNVIVDTTQFGGNINVVSSFSYISTNQLTLNARGDINILSSNSGHIANLSTGDIILNATGAINIESQSSMGTPPLSTLGNISANANKINITGNSQAVYQGTPTLQATGDISLTGTNGITLTGANLTSTSGNLSLTTTAGTADIVMNQLTTPNTQRALLNGKDILVIAGKSVLTNGANATASGKLDIVSDNAAGCTVGTGLLTLQNTTLTSTGLLSLYAATTNAVTLDAATTILNGVQPTTTGNIVAGTCYPSVANTPDPNYTLYTKNASAGQIATAIQQSNQALNNATTTNTTNDDFACASPRTLWILLLAFVRKVRRIGSQLFIGMRKFARVFVVIFAATLSISCSSLHADASSEEIESETAEPSTNPIVKGIVLVTSRDQLLPPEEAKNVCGVCCVGVALPDGTYCLNDRLYCKVNAPFCPEWLEELKCEIMAYYKDCNRPFMICEIPEQDITDGVVQVVVKEGKIGKIVCTGNEYYPKDYFADILGLREGGQVLYDVLSESVAWLGMRPFSDAELIFKPGECEGEVDIEIIARDRKPWRIFGGADNSGSKATSYYRVFAGAVFDNVFKSGGVLTYQYMASPDFKKLQSNFLGYMAPLRCGHIIGAYGGFATVKPHITDFKSKGYFGQASFGYSIPLKWRMCQWANNIGFGFNYKRLNNNLFFIDNPDLAIVDGSVNITQLLLSYNLGRHFGNHSISFSSQLIVSPGDLIAQESNHDYRNLQAGARSLYAYLKLGGDYIMYLPHEVTLTFKLGGQAATGTLLPSEQYSLGGVSSIRGYDPGEYLADNGVATSIEVFTPPVNFDFCKWKNAKGYLLFLGFIDAGLGNQYHPLAGTRKTDYLIGVGPGLRYKVDPYLEVDLDWGWKLHRVKGGVHRDQRGYFSVTASY